VHKFPENLWNLQKGCFMISPNEMFTGLLELSISRDFNVIKENNPKNQRYTKSLSWSRVLILLANRSVGESDGPEKYKPSAAILPNREGDQITDLPLEGYFDVVSAVRSLYGNTPTNDRDIVVVPSTRTSQGQDYGYNLMSYAVKVSVCVTDDQSSTDENNLQNVCRFVIDVHFRQS
jgi:hypothetical protein